MANLTFKSGMKLFASRNYQALYAQALAALRQNEKDPLGFFFIALIATEQGDHNKALELFSKAAELDCDSARYHAYHAKTLIALGQHEEAKLRANMAAKLKNDDAFVADMIGTVYSRTGDHDVALPCFEAAVKLNPKWALFHFNLGAAAQFLGDFDKAKTAYENVVRLNPGFYQAWFALVSLAKQTPENNHLHTLKNLFEQSDKNADAQLILGHAIAKTLEDLGQYPESLTWLKRAKSSKNKQVSFDRAAQTKVFETAKNWVQSTADIAQVSTAETPIFVVGLPRTGTTLVDRILSSHKYVGSAGETNILPNLIGNNIQTTKFDTQALKQIGDILYARILEKANAHNKFVIDKTPLNFFYIGLLNKMFPNARIIALRRGAMDSCLSNYRHVFASHTHDFDYTFDLSDTAWFYRKYDGLMGQYRENVPPYRFMEMHYEQMIMDQETQTRRLLDFCGLEWDAACLHFHENAAPVDTASSVQTRQPLYSGAIGRWKKYGHGLDELKNALGDLAD